MEGRWAPYAQSDAGPHPLSVSAILLCLKHNFFIPQLTHRQIFSSFRTLSPTKSPSEMEWKSDGHAKEWEGDEHEPTFSPTVSPSLGPTLSP